MGSVQYLSNFRDFFLYYQSMDAKEPAEATSASFKEKVLQIQCESSHSDELVYYNELLSRIGGEQLKKNIHRSLVALTFLDANKKISTGSGVLFSKNVVLTTAQNIFNKKFNAENTDFKIYVGANGVAEEYYQVEGWRYPEEFKTCKPCDNLPQDYAIMKLKKPISMQSDLSLTLACKQCLLAGNQRIELNVFGFPCTLPPNLHGTVRSFTNNFKPLDENGKRMKLYQYGLACKGKIKVIETERSKIGYKISTLPGQSGCPVIKDKNIIAVHVGGDNGKFNLGRIVDVSFMESLWKWREELNGAPFMLQDFNVCEHANETLEKMRYKLDLNWKKLKSVDLREYGNLMELILPHNQLRQIDLTHCPRLTTIHLGKNQLQRIDLTKHKHLTWLNLQDNQLLEIQVKSNINLTYLNLQNNQLKEIDVSSSVNITHLSLSGNQLQEINVIQNVNLTSLILSNNQLHDLDVRANVNLTRLCLRSNRITEIDITKNTQLKQLELQWNRLARVPLWIADNVQEQIYIVQFNLAHQQSAVCRVELQCGGQRQAIREKAISMVGIWMHTYSMKQENNNNCANSFLAF